MRIAIFEQIVRVGREFGVMLADEGLVVGAGGRNGSARRLVDQLIDLWARIGQRRILIDVGRQNEAHVHLESAELGATMLVPVARESRHHVSQLFRDQLALLVALVGAGRRRMPTAHGIGRRRSACNARHCERGECGRMD
jgi:hypothetical protein